MAELAELKPCPFCGGEATLYTHSGQFNDGMFSVGCDDCHISTDTYLAPRRAIELWNRRVDHA